MQAELARLGFDVCDDVHAGPRVVGKTEIHTWRYNRASGQRTAVPEFDLEQLKSITYESK